VDGTEEVHRPLVIPGGDGPELLQPGEEVLDQVACLVEVTVVGARLLAVALGRDHRRLAGLRQRLEHALVGVEGLVRDQGVGRETRQQGIGTFQVVRLPGREGKSGRVAQRVDRGVDFRAQTAAATPDRLVTVFLTAPALC
jgi:hypothetical protein